jgi:hypothetical protein
MLAGRLWWPALNACFKIPKVEAHLPMEGGNTSVDSTMKPQARILSICVLSMTAQKNALPEVYSHKQILITCVVEYLLGTSLALFTQ